jgi:hypothetical protein
VPFDSGAQIALIADTMITVAKAADIIEDLIKPFRAAKIVIGTVKQNCALALRFQAVFDNAKICVATRDNYLSAVRYSVNNGTKFHFNPALVKAREKAKAAKTAKPKDAAPTVQGIEDIPAGQTTPTPAGQTTPTPKRLLNQPSDVIDAVVVALSNVRANSTQESWNQVLVLNPAIAQFLDRAAGVWKTPPAVAMTNTQPVAPVAPVPTKKVRAPKK